MEVEIFEKISYKNSSEDNICSICLNDKNNNEIVYSCKRCMKSFHQDCIKKLLNYQNKCPNCRFNEDEDFLLNYDLFETPIDIITFCQISMSIEIGIKVMNIIANFIYCCICFLLVFLFYLYLS